MYIDQIAAAGPCACHDPTHNHTIGGGDHWVTGYTAMLDKVCFVTCARTRVFRHLLRHVLRQARAGRRGILDQVETVDAWPLLIQRVRG